MADQEDKRNPEQTPDDPAGKRDMSFTDGEIWKFGHQSGPPQARTGTAIPKQWQPPKNESTPNRRIKRT